MGKYSLSACVPIVFLFKLKLIPENSDNMDYVHNIHDYRASIFFAPFCHM